MNHALWRERVKDLNPGFTIDACCIKGDVVVKIDVFKELTPRSRTYELRSQGGEKKSSAESKTNKHLTPSYKNYLQKRPRPP